MFINFFCSQIDAREILATRSTRSWLRDAGYKILSTSSWLPDHGCQILATRSWIPDHGCQILDTRSVLQWKCKYRGYDRRSLLLQDVLERTAATHTMRPCQDHHDWGRHTYRELNGEADALAGRHRLLTRSAAFECSA